jgi:excisionase family DNA binding protein
MSQEFGQLLVTMNVAAEMLSVSVGTIKNMIKRGQLEVRRIGRAVRITVASIRKFLE